MTVVPLLGGIDGARQAIDEIRGSSHHIDLTWVPRETTQPKGGEYPWEKGTRLARDLRKHLGIDSAVTNEVLCDLLGAKLPASSIGQYHPKAMGGGYRNGANGGRTAM